jgi:hypothetical protein
MAYNFPRTQKLITYVSTYIPQYSFMWMIIWKILENENHSHLNNMQWAYVT